MDLSLLFRQILKPALGCTEPVDGHTGQNHHPDHAFQDVELILALGCDGNLIEELHRAVLITMPFCAFWATFLGTLQPDVECT